MSVVIFLPIVVLLVVFGVFSGAGSSFVVLLPMLFALAGGGVVVYVVMRDARPPRNTLVRQLPTDHLRRQMHRALRPNRPKRHQDRDKPAE